MARMMGEDELREQRTSDWFGDRQVDGRIDVDDIIIVACLKAVNDKLVFTTTTTTRHS